MLGRRSVEPSPGLVVTVRLTDTQVADLAAAVAG